MTTCIGIKKSDGQTCGKKCLPDKLYCGTHDPSKAKRKVKTTLSKEKRKALLSSIAKRTNYIPSDEDTLHKKFEGKQRHIVAEKSAEYVPEIVANAISKFARAEVDLKPFLKNDKKAVQFSRKIWMTISWFVSNDLKTYQAMSMTCKGLYDLCLKQKVHWYFHPLRDTLKSPQIYTFPIFRVIEFKIPDGFNDILRHKELPVVEDLLKQYAKEHGPPSNDFELAQRKGDVMTELCQTLISGELDSDEEFEEEIPGGGIYADIESKNDIIFENLGMPFKIYQRKGRTFVVIKPKPRMRIKEIERLLTKSLRNYHNGSLIQLMRVDNIK